jgi:hypothetical protein
MGKFLGWLAGILATVIAGWLIWYLEKPKPPTTFEGMVIDGALNAPVQNAMVSIEIKSSAPNGGPYHDFTDEHGSYRIDFSDLSKSSSVTFQVSAKGFQEPAPASLSIVDTDIRKDFVLTPVATPPSGGGVESPHTAAQAQPPAYIQKRIAQAIRMQIPPK